MEKDTASIDPVTIIDDTTVKPFVVDFEQGAIDELLRRDRCDSLADQGTRRRSLPGCAVGGDASARPLLDDRVRLAQV